MTKHGSDDVAFMLVDGYSILGVLTDINTAVTAVTEETTPLGVAWAAHESVNLKRAELSQNGFYSDAEDGVNEALSEQQDVARVICFGVEGNTAGKGLQGFAGAFAATYQRQASRATLHRANATYVVSGQVDECVIVEPLGAVTADGDTEDAALDNSAATASGGVGYLQVTALTLGGYTNLTVKLRDSADDTTYADLLTFTAVTEAPAAERTTVTGDVEQYLAASWSFTGTGSDPSATLMVGFRREPDPEE